MLQTRLRGVNAMRLIIDGAFSCRFAESPSGHRQAHGSNISVPSRCRVLGSIK